MSQYIVLLLSNTLNEGQLIIGIYLLRKLCASIFSNLSVNIMARRRWKLLARGHCNETYNTKAKEGVMVTKFENIFVGQVGSDQWITLEGSIFDK
jgi:hypothetical protein